MGGNSDPPQVKQDTVAGMNPEQQAMYNMALPFINQYANSGLPTLPTNTVAPLTGDQIQAQQKAMTAANGTAPLAQQAQTANSFLVNPDILSPDSNPYLKQYGDAVARSMSDNLNENVLPGLRSGATSAGGMYSGGATKEGIQLGLASGKNSLAIGDALKGLYSNAYGQGLSAMQGGINSVAQTQNNQLFPAEVQAAVGTQNQTQAQTELDAQNNLAQLQQMLPFLKAQDLMSLIAAIPGGSSSSTVTGALPKSGGGAMGALGGAASGAALGSMLFPGIGTAVGAVGGGLLGAMR